MSVEFWKYQDSWSGLKKHNLRHHFENKNTWRAFQIAMADQAGLPFAYRQAVLEEAWDSVSSPYYHCYPAILPMLIRLKLDIPCGSVDFSGIKALEVRLPRGQGEESPFRWDGHEVRSVLFGLQEMPAEIDSPELIMGLCACFDIGEINAAGDPIYSFKLFPLRQDKTIEEAMGLFSLHESANVGIRVPPAIENAVIKLCVCLALLNNDPSIITPDVLAKDAARWASASEEERESMVAMAHRRGKRGWNVGAAIEYAPHYRRPHPALVRVGKGRTFSRIIMRKGSVVHRSKLTEVPSGYEEDI